MSMLNFVWTGPILPSKKNEHEIFRKKVRGVVVNYIAPSAKYRQWEESFALDCRTLKAVTFKKPVRIDTEFRSPTLMEFDLSNKVESIMDGLVKAWIIVDDNIKFVPSASQYYKGKTNNKEWEVSVTITEIE